MVDHHAGVLLDNLKQQHNADQPNDAEFLLQEVKGGDLANAGSRKAYKGQLSARSRRKPNFTDAITSEQSQSGALQFGSLPECLKNTQYAPNLAPSSVTFPAEGSQFFSERRIKKRRS